MGGIHGEGIAALFGGRIRSQMVLTVQVSRSKPTPYNLRGIVSGFNIKSARYVKCRVRELDWGQLSQKRSEGFNDPKAQCDPTTGLLS